MRMRQFSLYSAALLMLASCAAAPLRPTSQANSFAQDPAPPATMQFLYGSGEAAALSRQAYAAFTAFAVKQASVPPNSRQSVVLAPAADLAHPAFTTCGGKPPAVVLDTDETAVLNLGFEADQAATGSAFDPQRWSLWERTGDEAIIAVPGAREAVEDLRAHGITVVFNSNRTSMNADHTKRQLDRLGFGPVSHGETLFLAGDDTTGANKDERRQVIAERYCVLAMAGDQLGDFSDRFNEIANPAVRRAATGGAGVAGLWGRGWFILPNPVYGPGIKGDMADVFPADRRWP